jgi:hypothetical protein
MLLGRITLGSALAAFAIAACGSPPTSTRVQASLETPKPRDARIALTPALDVTTLYDATLAARVVVDDIQVNLADTRLLGPDPRIPTGGLDLLKASRIVQADGSAPALELPFPSQLENTADLAVYVRLDKAPNLGDSSVVVRIRVYDGPAEPSSQPLTAAPDPDGDPARASATSSPEPDGDPAQKGCAPDPDGDPAHPRCATGGRTNQYLTGTPTGNFVNVELRGSDVADLVVTLGAKSEFDVVIGIPAAHWLNQNTMPMIDAALSSGNATAAMPSDSSSASTTSNAPIVVDSNAQAASPDSTGTDNTDPGEQDGYMLVDGGDAGRLKIYRY